MSEISAITRLREQRYALVEKMREVINTADAESRDLTAEELGEIETRETEISPLDKQIAVREKTLGLTTKLKVGDERALSPDRETSTINKPEDTEDYQRSFDNYLRTGLMEYRAALLSPNTVGGYTVPRGFLQQLVEYRTQFGNIRGLAHTFNTDSGNILEMPLLTGRGAAAWTAEAAAYNDADETFGSVTFSAWKATRLVKVSEELMRDSAFDLAGLLARRFGQSLSLLENTAFVNGTGSAQPTGLLDTAGLTSGLTTATNNVILFTELVDLVHSVGPQYRQNASWVFSDSILAYLRKIKTGVASDLRFLWQESMAGDVPDRLFNHPFYIDPDMPATTTNAPTPATKSVIFGDLEQAYWIRDVGPMVVRRLDERYADVGEVGFIVSARLDGKVVDNTAAKVMTVKT